MCVFRIAAASSSSRLVGLPAVAAAAAILRTMSTVSAERQKTRQARARMAANSQLMVVDSICRAAWSSGERRGDRGPSPESMTATSSASSMQLG